MPQKGNLGPYKGPEEALFQGTLCSYGIAAHMDANDGRCLFREEERDPGLTIFFFQTCQGKMRFVKEGEVEEVVSYSTEKDVSRILKERGEEFVIIGPNGLEDEIFYVVEGNLLYHTFQL